ncbi:MAG: glycosyltransferase family 39 protein [Gammaproteobacteria bacterium]|nr:glycosyltransferase family 39 protein [Gammaproteobacteria bacterium]
MIATTSWERLCGWLPRILALTLFFAGLATSGLSLLSYDAVRGVLDPHAADGSADALTRELFHAISARLRLAGGGLGALALLLWMLDLHARVFVLEACRSLAEHGRRWRFQAVTWGRTTDPVWIAALLIVIGVGVAARALLLEQPMRYDEAFTFVNYVDFPLYLGLTRYDAPNNHLLHTLLAHISDQLFGSRPWSLRIPAFLAGVALIPVSYVLVQRLYDRQAGLIAAALVAGSGHLILYSVNARGYTIVAVLFAVCLLLAIGLRQREDAGYWLLLVPLAALGLYTVPTMMYAVAFVLVWLSLQRLATQAGARRLPGLVRVVVAGMLTGILTLLLYLPVLVRSSPEEMLSHAIMRDKMMAKAWPDFLALLTIRIEQLWETWHEGIPGLIALAFLALAVAAWIWHRRISRIPLSPVWAVLAGCIPLLFFQRNIPPIRAWSFLLPVYFGMIAAGFGLASAGWFARAPQWKRFAPPLIAILLSAGLAVESVRETVRDGGNFPAAEAVARFLEQEVGERDRFVLLGLSLVNVQYYLSMHGARFDRLVFDHVLQPWGAARKFENLYVVVNDRSAPSRASFATIPVLEAAKPTVVAEFREARVYRLPGTALRGSDGE